MALDISSTLSTLKINALSSIIGSMSINYPAMVNTLSSLSQVDTLFQSLLNLYVPTFTKLSSDDMNGATLLAYLDFYTLYIILYANVNPIKNLQNITQNKMSYLESIYKDTDTILSEKSLQKTNKYVLYTNFLNPKHIDLTVSNAYLLSDKLSSTLNISPILTLPIEKTQDIDVLSASSIDTDSYVNIITNNNLKNSINYSIGRKGFNKIGVTDSVTPMKTNNTYAGAPLIAGTIHGYFSDSLSISVADFSLDTNGKLSQVSIIGSSDNLVWSDPVIIPVDTATTFLIDNQFDVGLTIKFNSNLITTVGDSWKINIRYIDLDNPKLISTIKFMSLNKVSYISWDDLTKDSTDFVSHRIKYRQAEQFTDLTSPIFSNGINSVTPIFNSVNDYELTIQQNSYNIKTINSSLVHSFDYNLENIKAVYNEYGSYGITSFNGLDIKNESPILNVAIDANQYIYTPANNTGLSKQFIEHTLVVTFGEDVVFIPCLNKLDSVINEYIVPTINSSGVAIHSTRFPVDYSEQIIITNVSTGSIMTLNYDYTLLDSPINQDNTTNYKKIINIPSYDMKSVYVITYTPKVNDYTKVTNYNPTVGNCDWIYNNTALNSSIYYMYFKDINGYNKIALSTLDFTSTLTPFYGKVSSIIEMRSLDQGYLSPVIFDYKLLGN